MIAIGLAAFWIYRATQAGESTVALRSVVAPAPPARSSSSPPTSPSVPTRRGEFVRSRAEARIADFLHAKGIRYEYEPTICGFRPDFYISEWNLIIEHWGLKTPEYLERRSVKSGAYRSSRFSLIGLEPEDWPQLENVLQRKLYAFDRTIYRRWGDSAARPPSPHD